MRVRQMSAAVWACCLVVCCFILYVMTDLTFKMPSGKQGEEVEKWQKLENKLQNIEYKLSQHHKIVGDIKNIVDEIDPSRDVNQQMMSDDNADKQRDYRETNVDIDKTVKKKIYDLPLISGKSIKVDSNMSASTFEYNNKKCHLTMDSMPTSDVQMLPIYESMDFTDIDGGVWKQGWNIEYNEKQWSKNNKLKVFIVPHSHNDPGWINTFESYYKSQTRIIFKNMVARLTEDTRMKFIWAETSFLSLWWNQDASSQEKDMFKKLLHSGQIEIVTGGWVMNDEANSHWLSVIQQLTAGHQWLMDNMEYIPHNGWAIDPFGHSSTQAYLLKLTEFNNILIQRVHYRVKKALALNKQLEFRWRQSWDETGKTDLFTHMMPFYAYDIPHTCGPDPKICCQFDFKRLPGNGVSCPWKVKPQEITTKNVQNRSLLILDQWRKKAQLYKSNVVLIPLGDDFRWDRSTEWDLQMKNYEMLIDHINSQEDFNAEVKWGTLADYFKAVHNEVKMEQFPTLSGDFFTYADRADHYWSGYYTTRPFYKTLDRVVLAYVRAAEMITAQVTSANIVSDIMSLQLRDRVFPARAALSLFQHHDGVTGTARTAVVLDYALKLIRAVKQCQSAIQEAAYHLLGKPQIIGQVRDDLYFEHTDLWLDAGKPSSKSTIILDEEGATKIVVYNSLVFRRIDLVTVHVSTPYIRLFDSANAPVEVQISPVITNGMTISNTKYALSWYVNINAMSLSVYTLTATTPEYNNDHTKFARILTYNHLAVESVTGFEIKQVTDDNTIELSVTDKQRDRLLFNSNGLLKAVHTRRGVVPVHMDFVSYDSSLKNDHNSGAYLFIPSGDAKVMTSDDKPNMIMYEGPLLSSLNVKQSLYTQTINLLNNPSKPSCEIEFVNAVDITSVDDDFEVAMRLSTSIKSGNTFYTDLNGIQMVKREFFTKLPLQANFYPLPSTAYIEDDNTRLTLITSGPLGVTSITSGQIEIMQDRKLLRDDNRGLGQGIVDNVPTRHTIRMLIEERSADCQKRNINHPSGSLSVGAHVTQQQLLSPLISMSYRTTAEHHNIESSVITKSSNVDIVLASYRPHLIGKVANGDIIQGYGAIIHRTYLDMCYTEKQVLNFYPVGDGNVELSDFLEIAGPIHKSSLTHNNVYSKLNSTKLTLCPMDVFPVFVNQTLFTKNRN